ncbi:Hydrolase, alpha/beta fold family functionally coupled to Phosphoribulokinase [Pseudoalteromonas luteoviolacea B = ATCC 29581]|nr:Hydrolase, alpha/beta fold family functionally coupled to Phosphoribulokinase [Pseudoalteromonas luteoviolacea B = ATCC 29581]
MEYQFKPAWWMTNRHVQTILPRAYRLRQHMPVHMEKLATPDGDFLELAWAKPAKQEAPLVIVLHGLEGNIDSFYARGMMEAAFKQGFDAVLMHFRNCSAEPNRMPRAYHSGETEDLGFLVDTLRRRFPDRCLYAVGFSLGGNVLTKYLGEQGKHCQLKGASVVSAPFDLSSSCQVIRRSCFKLYQKYLLDKLKRSTARKLAQVAPVLQLDHKELMNINDLWQFDERVTAPLHGFNNAEDYYTKASGKPYLKKIAIPTLVIHAEDDPMLSEQAIPKIEDVSESVRLAVSHRGGHVGFLSGYNPLKPVFWLEYAVPHFFTTLRQQSHYDHSVSTT